MMAVPSCSPSSVLLKLEIRAQLLLLLPPTPASCLCDSVSEGLLLQHNQKPSLGFALSLRQHPDPGLGLLWGLP